MTDSPHVKFTDLTSKQDDKGSRRHNPHSTNTSLLSLSYDILKVLPLTREGYNSP